MEASPQTPRLFNYYNFYRVIIGLLLLGMTFSQQNLLQNFRYPDLFQIITLGYLLINIALFGFYKLGFIVSPRQVFSTLTLDILVLHGLFYCSSGISGGLINLLLITVAAGNIMIRGRIGLSFAAMATILSISVEIERLLANLSHFTEIARAGLMGSIYFATAYILQNLAIRISQSELLASQRQQDIIELEKLNHQIIQSMRTGIIVCDENTNIKVVNQACQDLIGLAQGDSLPAYITDRIKLWKDNPDIRTTPFQAGMDKPMVQVNFSRMKKEKGSEILIFVEDTRLMSQQAQQLKLASLGRLTASIAHEVRNPLGAISHASQLLAESSNLDLNDKRMTDIIERHSKRVNQIIENTLQLSRRSEPETQDITIGPWLEKMIDDYLSHDETRPVIKLVQESENAHARFDVDQMEQVLINLLDNGIRHGRKTDAEAVLLVKLAETTTGHQAYIDVIDQGTGIAEADAHHLFEPFFTTESQGTGLGLYLSREMCEANQARLDYIDSYEAGTCFRLTFAHHRRIV